MTKITFQERSGASLPGNMEIDFAQTYRCLLSLPGVTNLPIMYISGGMLILMLGILAWSFTGSDSPHQMAKIGVALGVMLFSLLFYATFSRFYRTLKMLKRKFKRGCVTPAIVLDASQGLLAGYTDLSTRPDESRPTIKVYFAPLHRIKERTYRSGDRVATVSLYFGSDPRAQWDTFSPTPVDCVTRNRATVAAQLRRLDDHPDDWAALESAILNLPKPYDETQVALEPQAILASRSV